MSNNSLKLWVSAVDDYCKKNGKPYHVPRVGTAEHSAIKKIYEAKKNGNAEPEKKSKCKNCKSFKCRCSCPYPKPAKS